MHPDALSFLACPDCVQTPADASLTLHNPTYRADDNRLETGELACRTCGKRYPIRRCIPRFTGEDGLQGTVQGDIADNFGDAWTIYAEKQGVNPYQKEQFLDWVEPLQEQDFTGKTVLEMGSGLGGFTAYAAGFGAKQVVGLEISHAVDAAYPLLAEHPNLSFVQANLLKPPFKKGAFDLVYSIGVLHHLEKPRDGFRQVATQTMPGGQSFIWVYGRENNEFVVYVVEPLRKIMSKLPVSFVRWAVAFPMSLVLYPLLHTVYNPGLPEFFRQITEKLPYYDYFQWLRKYGFGYVVGMVTDQLIPPRTHYLRQEELRNWFREEGLDLTSITHRNRMSWRALGDKKSS